MLFKYQYSDDMSSRCYFFMHIIGIDAEYHPSSPFDEDTSYSKSCRI